MEIVKDLKEVVLKLNELDKYLDSMSELESNVDMKISDLLHYIENNNLKTNECYRIVKEINKTNKDLNKGYKNRVYTDEDFKNLLGGKKK